MTTEVAEDTITEKVKNDLLKDINQLKSSVSGRLPVRRLARLRKF